MSEEVKLKAPRKVKSERFKFPKFTPAQKKAFAEKRRKYSENMTMEYKLGWLIGQAAWRKMPTTTYHWIKSSCVIEIPDTCPLYQEHLEADQNVSQHYFKPGYDEFKETPEFKKLWDKHIAAMRALDKKYLPETYEFHCSMLVEDTPEFRKGLYNYLWNCDGCTYSLKDENISFSTETFDFTTIITFKRDEE